MNKFVKKNYTKFSKWFRNFIKKVERTKKVKNIIKKKLIIWDKRTQEEISQFNDIVNMWLDWWKVCTTFHSNK